MSHRNIKVVPVLIAAVLALLASLVVAPAASAYPGDLGTGVVVPGGGGGPTIPPTSGHGEGGNTGNGGGNNNGGGSNGGGGSSDPNGMPSPIRLYGVKYWPNGKQSLPMLNNAFIARGKCPANKWGARIGANYSYVIAPVISPLTPAGWLVMPKAGSLQFSCIDSPHWEDRIHQCAITVGPGSVTGPYNNPTVAASTIASAGVVTTAFQKGGRKNVGLCAQSYQVNISAQPDEFGHWQARATGRSVNCTLRTYTTPDATRRIPAAKIIGCTSPISITSLVKGTLWCSKAGQPGWSTGWTSHDFTMTSCNSTNGSGGRWQCVIGSPTYAGAPATLAKPARVIDDGKNRTLAFGKVTVTGAKNVRAKQTRLKVYKDSKHDSTPWRTGVTNPAAATQPFATTPAPNVWVNGWTGTSKGGWAVNFQSAGMPGKPWQARQDVRFTGDFLLSTIKITGINLKTKKITSTVANKWVTQDATCSSPVASINAFRARLTN